ncbi:lactate utilisation protein LutB domain-containing protein, partial [Escherichia coli]
VKIPLATLIQKHRQVMAESEITPLTERRITRAFNYINSHPALWKVGMVAGAKTARLFIRKGKTPISVGAIKEWTEARDLPSPDGESFRSWFKRHKKEG